MLWKIERAKPCDAAGVKAIERGAGLSRWREQDYASEALRKDSIFLVAKDKETGSSIGFIIVRLITQPSRLHDLPIAPFEAELLNLGVLPSFRRKGIGGRLIEEAVRELGCLGTGTVHLEVRARNEPAIGLYKQFGFEVNGRRPGFYREPSDDAVLMKLNF